jgi:uncharacterized protein YndB with AHSA1/START domain
MQRYQEQNSMTSIHKNSTPVSKLLEIRRGFNVSVENLFAAFKASETIKEWWWPQGLYTDQVDIDFREGGGYFINMKGLDGGGGGMTGEFKEIIENRRIVMTDQFADKNGRAITAAEAKMPGVWPKVVYITFEFAVVDGNTSQLVLSQEGIPNEMQEECIKGWSQMFDKLEKYLTKGTL